MLITAKISSETNGVRINLKSVSGVDVYYVYRADITSYQGDWSKVVTIKNPSTQSYFDETVKFGRTYAYRIKAYYGTAVSAGESLITGYIAAPKLISVKNEKDGICVNRNNVKGAVEYIVYRKKDKY